MVGDPDSENGAESMAQECLCSRVRAIHCHAVFLDRSETSPGGVDGDGRLAMEFHANGRQPPCQMVPNGCSGAHIPINVMLSQHTCKPDMDELAANLSKHMADHIAWQTIRTL